VVEEILSSPEVLFSMELAGYIFLPHIPIASIFDTKMFILHLHTLGC
jgi:hypothetical protein